MPRVFIWFFIQFDLSACFSGIGCKLNTCLARGVSQIPEHRKGFMEFTLEYPEERTYPKIPSPAPKIPRTCALSLYFFFSRKREGEAKRERERETCSLVQMLVQEIRFREASIIFHLHHCFLALKKRSRGTSLLFHRFLRGKETGKSRLDLMLEIKETDKNATDMNKLGVCDLAKIKNL